MDGTDGTALDTGARELDAALCLWRRGAWVATDGEVEFTGDQQSVGGD